MQNIAHRTWLPRVLVVEGRPAKLRLLTDSLEKDGLEVVGCASARDARYHVGLNFGLVIVGMNVRDFEYTQLLNQLRACQPQLPVLLNRNQVSSQLDHNAVNPDGVTYVENTDDHQELLRHIHRLLLANYDRYAQELEQSIEARTVAKRELQRDHDQLRAQIPAGWERINLALEEEVNKRQRVEATLKDREQQLMLALESRETLCQDLHDGVLQLLYVVGLDLERSKPLLQQDPPAARQAMDHAIGLVNSVMKELRFHIACFDQRVQEGEDFHSMVEIVVKQLGEITPVKCEVSVDPAASQRLTKNQTFHLTYIVQEAISNSLRHGKATTVGTSLWVNGQSISLQVRDDGVGFSTGDFRGPGQGLRNMALRTKKIGGHLIIDSKPSQGTSILVNLPRAG